jgi:hypothetical protein
VRGAVIRFLGRRLVTNARGRATTRARFVRPGRHRVLVTRRGARSVRAVVRVFPPLPRGAGELDENERPCFAGRWPVKTASDPRARLIDPRPIPIRLTSLWRLPPPFPRVRFGTPRLPGIERHVYRMRVRLVTIQLMLDRDIHLVVAEPGRPRRTMIVEFAHPNCRHARRSRFARQFRVARTALLQACGLAKRRQRRIVGAGIVTGVGFWDTRHGQFGVARNGIELHPVTGYVSRGCRAAGPRRRR